MTYDEREVKLGFQFSFTRGIPSILASDGRQEVAGDLVTERPFVRQPRTSRFEKRVECAALLVNREREVDNIKKLCGGGDVLFEILKQQRLGMLRLIPCTKQKKGQRKLRKWSWGCSPSGV